MKAVPQADAKSASTGWFFDPGFIQNVQRVASDIETPSMESIDSVLFALREMGYIKTASTCEHGFTVDECVTGICELQTEHAALRARVARLEDALQKIADGRGMIPDKSTIYMSGRVPQVPKHFNMYDMREIAATALENQYDND